MLDLISFNKSLKTTWIKKNLGQENYGKWKIFLDLELNSQAGNIIFSSNISAKDADKYINISDLFFKKKSLIGIWTEINFENRILSTKHFQTQHIWHNTLLRIGNKPVFF